MANWNGIREEIKTSIIRLQALAEKHHLKKEIL